MLGRMGMNTEDAIKSYEDFAEKVFRKRNRRFNRTFREKTLEGIIQLIVARKKLEKTVMLDAGREKGLTFVCAVSTHDKKTPCLFRTYKGTSNHAHNVEIWEAARATTAAPTFFDPISIKIEAEWDQYIDGAVSFNNPALLVLNEAEDHFGPERKLGFLLSLGTGLKITDKGADVDVDAEAAARRAAKKSGLPRKDSGSLISHGTFDLLKYAKTSLTDTEPTHNTLQERFRGIPYAYFRFNLDRGASDIKLHKYKEMHVLRTATEEYLRNVQVSADIDKVVSMLYKNEGVSLPLDAACKSSPVCA